MKAKKVGNLFQLKGRTESDHVSTVSENDSNSIRLWHQRLGHMSERGLKILSDRKFKVYEVRFLQTLSIWETKQAEV